MSKIKINLTSGNVVEKPLVTCFKGTNGNYAILDNELNGSMGYPIICVCKYTGNGLEKIVDPNEWTQVKENLKSIISGNKMEYLSIDESIAAPDDFFTQLTLPVPSFDILKNAYAPAPSVAPDPVEAPVVEPETPSFPVENPLPDPMAISSTLVAPLPTDLPAPEITAPTVDNASIQPMESTIAAPVESTPTVSEEPMPTFTAPVMPEPPVAPVLAEEQPAPLMPSGIMPDPIMPDVQESSASSTASTEMGVDIESIKAEFMQACENVFEALVNKFNK